MTDFPDLKVKMLVSFPANVIGGTGIEVNKVNGHYNIDLDFSEFEPPGRVTDYDNQHVLLWDAIENRYIIVPARSVCAGGAVPEADDDGVLYGRRNLAWEPITSGGGGTPSNTDPVMDGVATEGILATYSRGDHVHPSDTSRVAKDGSSSTMTGPLILYTDTPGSNREAASKKYVDDHASTGSFLPKLYIAGLEPAISSATTITIPVGVCANEAGTELLENFTNLIIDITANFGNLKLDKGTRQNGMGYSVFIIRHIVNKTMGAILSTSRFSVQASTPAAQTFTVSIASPAVFTKTAHGINDGAIVVLSTAGVGAHLPTGLQIDEAYFVNVTSTSTFQLSKTLEGPAINTSGTQSGTHTVTCEYVNVPSGYEFWRKLPIGVMYNTTATPSAPGFLTMHVSHWPMPHIRLTQSQETTVWAVVNGGISAAYVDVHPATFVPYDARLVHIRCITRWATGAGSSFIRTAGLDGVGFTVGRVETATDVDSSYHTIAVTSTGRFQYHVTGGAKLYIYILGYDWTQNS